MRCIKILLIAMVICTLLGCSKEEQKLKINLSPTNKVCGELITQVYESVELSNIAGFRGSLNELDAEYPIECIREVDNVYRVTYCGEKCVVTILFDKSQNWVLSKQSTMTQEVKQFSNIVIGTSLTQVQEIDPQGEYAFLYTGRDDIPRVSYHYTIDGYIITIGYDSENMVTSVTKEIL